MTKVGLISDIHADWDGLVLALRLFKRLGVDCVLCAGDLVDRGSDGEKIVRFFRRFAIPTVMGNHDFIAADNQDYVLKYPDRNLGISILTSASVNYLKHLLQTTTLRVGGRQITMGHGSLINFNHRIEPFDKPQVLHRIFQQSHADYIVLGHTHIPMVVETNTHRKIINLGSTYSNYPPDPALRSCAVLDTETGDVTHYDLDTGDSVRIFRRRLEEVS